MKEKLLIIEKLLKEPVDTDPFEITFNESKLTISVLNLSRDTKMKMFYNDVYFVDEVLKLPCELFDENELEYLLQGIQKLVDAKQIEIVYSKSENVTEEEECNPVENTAETIDEAKISTDGTPLERAGLSVRSYNALKRSGINFIEELYEYNEEKLSQIRNLGKTSINEILTLINSADTLLEQEEIDPNEDICAWAERHSDVITDFFSRNDIMVEEMEMSVRAYNGLRINKITGLSGFVGLSAEQISHLDHFGKGSAKELRKLARYYIRQYKAAIIAFIDNQESEVHITMAIEDMPVIRIINDPLYFEKAATVLQKYGTPCNLLNFSVRTSNALQKAGINTFYELFKNSNRLSEIGNLGEKSINEVQNAIQKELERLRSLIISHCSEDSSLIFNDQYIENEIMNLYKDSYFKGISYRSFRNAFPEEIEDQKIKDVIGRLLGENKLEYVDFRCYRKYMSFYDAIDAYATDDRQYQILRERFANGKTLEEVATTLDVTRERVRQIQKKTIVRFKALYVSKTGLPCFDEDYYSYLFENYSLDKDIWTNWLNVSERTYYYLRNTYDLGKAKIDGILTDEMIDAPIKLKIRNYLDRDKIIIDGKLIRRKRADLEDYALEKYCREEKRLDEFADLYNQMLKENNIEYDESIYLSDEVARTRLNRFAASMNCLYSEGKRIRFYDIEGKDFTELLDTLNLENFSNTEISTMKFIEDYPELMQKFEIHHQYELHNLLKKIVDPSACHEIDFNRQPILKFGSFNRSEAVYELICTFSPVSHKDLIEYIHSEYGYEKLFIQMNMLQEFSHLYHNGIYNVDFVKMPENRMNDFKAELKKDFYFTDELCSLYKEKYPDADISEVNPFVLKSMGFTVFSKYVLQNCQSLKEYFNKVLMEKDMFSIRDFNKKYGHIVIANSVYMDLQRNFDIIEFEPSQIINFRRLEKNGYTKDDLIRFCERAEMFADDDSYFNIYTLRANGFTSKLDELGFDDYFYNSILCMSQRFVYQKMLRTHILYKGDLNQEITRNGFIASMLKDYESIGLDDFIEEIKDSYGIASIEGEEVKAAVKEYGFYYDTIMDKIYMNENCYYAEFDD